MSEPSSEIANCDTSPPTSRSSWTSAAVPTRDAASFQNNLAPVTPAAIDATTAAARKGQTLRVTGTAATLPGFLLLPGLLL